MQPYDRPMGSPRIRFIVCVLVASGALAACSAKTAGTGEPTFAALRNASGCTAWRDLSGVRTSGDYFADGLHFRFSESLDARSGRFARSWSTATGLGGAEGFDGTRHWVEDRSGGWHDLDSPHARELTVTQTWLNRRAWCDPALDGAAVSALGPRTQALHTSDAFRVTPAGGAPVEMWIDRTTHLIDQTIVQLTESREIDYFSRWSSVRGALVPASITVSYPEDQTVEHWVSSSLSPLEDTSGIDFGPPPQPRDVSMLNGKNASIVPLLIEGVKPLIGVRLDGIGPLPYVVDTGGHFIATTATAHHVGLRGIGAANSLGAGTGILRASFARVSSIRIGSATIADQIAKVMPFGFAHLERGPRPPKAGWLGLELFERFAVTMDPQAQRLTLRPLPAMIYPKGARIPIFFDEDAPLIFCRIAGHPGVCMIDTGNAGYTIIEARWAKSVGLTPNPRASVNEGGGWRAARATLAFGPFALPREVVDYAPSAPRGSESTTTVAAILSEDVIRRYVMTVDYDEHAAWFQPIPGAEALPYDRCGLEVDKLPDGLFTVADVIPGSPADAVGLHKGDRILAVNGEPSSRFSAADLYALSAGPVGTSLSYEVADSTGARRMIRLRLRELLP
jgi:hypothetical protein